MRKALLYLFLWMLWTGSAPAEMVADQISAALVQEDLKSRPTVYLHKLLRDEEKRHAYLSRLYANQQMEAAVRDQDLLEDPALLADLRIARNRILLDHLVRNELAKRESTLEDLAKERYESHRDQYHTPSKIKIAILFIHKGRGREEAARKLMDEIDAKLRAHPEDHRLFLELAYQYSDDRKAKQGGFDKRWLIEPPDLEQRDPVMRAVFALEKAGEMTPVIETESGFTVAKLMAKQPSVPLSFDLVKKDLTDEIRAELYKEIEKQLLASFQPGEDFQIDEAQLKALVENALQSRQTEDQPTEEAAQKKEAATP